MKRGMSLIELLIGMFIAGLVSYIAFDLIRDEQGNYTRTRTKVRLQGDAREAIRIIEEDLANIGYRKGLLVVPGKPGTSDTTASPINAKIHACDTAASTQMKASNRLIVRDDNGTGSDTIEAQFYRPTLDSGVACNTSPWFVRYEVTDSQLVRHLWKPGQSHTVGNEEKATILENVATMQAQVDLDTALHPASTPLASQTFNYPVVNGERQAAQWSVSSANVLMGTSLVPLSPKGDSAQSFSGWHNNATVDLTYQSTNDLLDGSTYQISCMIRVNQAFHNLFNLGATNGILSARAIVGTDTLGTTRLSLPNIVDGPTWVSWMVQTRTQSGPLSLMFQGQLADDSTGCTPVLDIGSLKVTRLQGKPRLTVNARTNWQNGSASSSKGLQTKGLRVWLVARSPKANKENDQLQFTGIGNWNQNTQKPSDKNSYVVYERTIPVVRYGY